MELELAAPHAELRARGVRPSLAMAGVLAFLGGCPVLLNLLGTYVSDGDSFAITAGGTLAALALFAAAALRVGMPRSDLAGLHGPTLSLAVLAGLFWLHWLAVNAISPSP